MRSGEVFLICYRFGRYAFACNFGGNIVAELYADVVKLRELLNIAFRRHLARNNAFHQFARIVAAAYYKTVKLVGIYMA